MDTLTQRNRDLKTFKGIGSVRFKENETLQTLRAAWMGECPKKFRIEALSALGQPMASLAGDGEWIYYRSHARQQFRKEPYGSGFHRVLSIPVDPEELVSLLCGKLPEISFHEATLVQNPDASGGYVLALKRRWHGTVGIFYLDPEKRLVLGMERFDPRGNLRYRMDRSRFKAVGSFEIPFRIQASDDSGVFFELTVDRYWTNMPLDSTGFNLFPTLG